MATVYIRKRWVSASAVQGVRDICVKTFAHVKSQSIIFLVVKPNINLSAVKHTQLHVHMHIKVSNLKKRHCLLDICFTKKYNLSQITRLLFLN